MKGTNKRRKPNKRKLQGPKETTLFFDPFAPSVDKALYYNADPDTYEGQKPEDVSPWEESEDDEEELEEDVVIEKPTARVPPAIRHKIRKNEVLEDLGLIKRGMLGPHSFIMGQNVAVCVPYEESDSDSDDDAGKEKWVIAVVIGYDKKTKLYKVKDKYVEKEEDAAKQAKSRDSRSSRARGVKQGGPSPGKQGPKCWEVSANYIVRFPMSRHPKYRPKEKVLALWRTKDGDDNGAGTDDDWTSMFYEAIVVDPDSRPGFIRIDYGGEASMSNTRLVRLDKVISVGGRTGRRTGRVTEDGFAMLADDGLKAEEFGGGASNKLLGDEDAVELGLSGKPRRKAAVARDRDIYEREKEPAPARGPAGGSSTRPRKPAKPAATAAAKRDSNPNATEGGLRMGMLAPEVLTYDPQVVDLQDDARIRYFGMFLSPEACNALSTFLTEMTQWYEDGGKLFACFGDAGTGPILNSGYVNPLPWNDLLQQVRLAVQRLVPHKFNSLILHRYRTGNDHLAPHAEDQPSLGLNPVIAIISLGGGREIKLKHKDRDHRRGVDMADGSMLVMEGTTQSTYEYHMPKSRYGGEVIHLTFRRVLFPRAAGAHTANGPVPIGIVPAMAPPKKPLRKMDEGGSSIMQSMHAHDDLDMGQDDDRDDESMLDDDEGGRSRRGQRANETTSLIGEPGVPHGARFANRMQLNDSGVHRILIGAICGTAKGGAESLLLGTTQEDDPDKGDEFVYTAMGATKRAVTGNQPQSPSSELTRGTQALLTSYRLGLPVRVIRSWKMKSRYAPTEGFSYDGLYHIVEWWEQTSKQGVSALKFRFSGPMTSTPPRYPSTAGNNPPLAPLPMPSPHMPPSHFPHHLAHPSHPPFHMPHTQPPFGGMGMPFPYPHPHSHPHQLPMPNMMGVHHTPPMGSVQPPPPSNLAPISGPLSRDIRDEKMDSPPRSPQQGQQPYEAFDYPFQRRSCVPGRWGGVRSPRWVLSCVGGGGGGAP
eukprot:TRINITY_DN4993_c0_g1_i8.p1 TRINITY_DN4993_c0_g1~~TRINITY_DN4993_c0_g1_i8.p1  ORF type:complete len:985 (+),score=269.86 TRINITY_DN4993_c0_g1_i8:149-3103(+)